MLKKFLSIVFIIFAVQAAANAHEVFIRDDVLPVTKYIFHNSDDDMFVKIPAVEKPVEIKPQENTNVKDISSETNELSTEENVEKTESNIIDKQQNPEENAVEKTEAVEE